jgi:hypothetical protein
MKNLFAIVLLFIVLTSSAQDKKASLKTQIVEVSCGECQFGLKGKGCDLAVRINGKSYFVDGTKIDDHGDAHAKDGFCEIIRKAEVTGEIVNDRFKVVTFTLLPEKK